MHRNKMSLKGLVAAIGAIAAALFPLAALAQDGGAGAPKTFLPYVFAVYTVTWAAFFGYAFYMARRQRELRREIDELRQQQADKGAA